MCYLSVLLIFMSSVGGIEPMGWLNVGGGLFAQQAPPVFTDAKDQSESSQQSSETGTGISESDVSKSDDNQNEVEDNLPRLDKAEDWEAYSQELKRAVKSGEMTEKAASKAWSDAKLKAKKAGGESDEDVWKKDWIGEHLVLILVIVYGSIFVVVAGIVAVCYRVVKRREQARTDVLKATTAELGLKFKAEGDTSLMVDLESLPLFNQGRRKKLTNLIEADTPDLQMQVFDYQFITGYGKSQKTHRTTVVSVRSSGLVLPSLQVRPRKAFADGIKSMFGSGGMEMSQYPEFAKNYVLQSDQPDQARDFLDAKMVAVCESNPDCTLECQSGVLLHFRANKRVEANADAIRGFIGEGFELFQDVSENLERHE
jgi:hypothetical protein